MRARRLIFVATICWAVLAARPAAAGGETGNGRSVAGGETGNGRSVATLTTTAPAHAA